MTRQQDTAAPAVVPAPEAITLRDGAAFVHRAVRVSATDPTAAAAAPVVAASLARLLGIPVTIGDDDDGSSGVVLLSVTADRAAVGVGVDVDPARAVGAYLLTVDGDRVSLLALDAAGLVHGAATLAQCARTGGGTAAGTVAPTLEVPALEVRDVPRFGWRGLSLDVARSFFDVGAVRTVLDVMADLKLNVLHLHLTDDQGWRLEIPSRPELTRLSGGSAVDGGTAGFYTVEDFADLVAAAAARGITVVPEIDLPGHVNAALHAYGELTPSGEPVPAYTGIEVGFSRLHADLPSTGEFLRDVLTDVAAQTPGPYVHIGGDEVLTMAPAEYAELVGSAAEHLRAAGKTVVGWQEIGRTAPAPGTIVQYWTHEQPAEEVAAAVRGGALLLLSPGRRVYLDMKYDATTALGLEWAGHIELRDAYDWDPLDIVPGVPESAVVGVEAAIWSETLRSVDDLMSLLLPRLAAVAEVAWSSAGNRDWDDFSRRVGGPARQWSRAGLPWYRSPQVTWPDEG
ncbi:MAG: hypothetical protein JWP95_492 [Actinotalea sp.]|nr:hypothetical protein [Actinotalea sp.]